MTCEGCINYGTKDSGYGAFEEHGDFCYLHYEWWPRPCEDYEKEEEDYAGEEE